MHNILRILFLSCLMLIFACGAEESANLDPDSFIIKEAFADGGPHLKRFRAASMGRISRINKPTSHLTIIISDDS